LQVLSPALFRIEGVAFFLLGERRPDLPLTLTQREVDPLRVDLEESRFTPVAISLNRMTDLLDVPKKRA
jgi:hypothetical protein